jgi:hypothetical protein
MKHLFVVLLSIIVTFIFVSTGDAKTTTVKDKSGRKVGTAQKSGSTTVYRDKSGRKVGTSTRSGNTSTVRDKSGKRVGTVKHKK